MVLLLVCMLGGCRPEGLYTRGDAGPPASGGAPAGTGGSASGGAGPSGTGGSPVQGSGGSVGSGGRVSGTGGEVAIGGSGGGGPGTGGGSGGGGAAAGSGGQGTGGMGTGGTGTGGAGADPGTGGAGGTGTGGIGGGGPQLILSIDFVGGITAVGGAGGAVLTAAPAMLATELAGFKPASNWNSAPMNTGVLANLLLADGTPTAAMVTWSSPVMGTNPGVWKNAYPDAPGDPRMMNGYLDPTAAATPAVVTVGGLPAAIATGGYDVYVYMVGDIVSATTRTYGYTIGATTFTVSQTGPTPTVFGGFVPAPPGGAGNYIVFPNVTGASFTLTATPGTGTPTRAPVNGIQIVSPTGS